MARRFWISPVFLLSCLALSLSNPLHSAQAAEESSDWPQWRGHNRDGMSRDSNLLQEWPEGGPPLAWRTDGIGWGFSTVSVSNGYIFTMGDIDEYQYVMALNQEDGSMVWKTKVGNAWEDKYGGPRSTPTVSDGRLYLVTSNGDLYCVEARTGAEVWRKSLTSSFSGGLMQAQDRIDWRFAESPLVDGNRVIVTPGHRHAALVALDKANGEEIWRSAIPELGEKGRDGAAYSSAVISHGGGVKQYVQLMGRGLIGVEAETGRFLWGYNRVANDVANIATPIVGGDYVFTSTGYRTGSALLKLSPEGNGIRADEVYWLEANIMQNHHGGLILHEGYIYTGTGHNKGFPISAKFETGEVAWGPIRNEGADSAAIAYADGRLYLRYQNGLVILIEATPEEYRERGSFMIPDVERPSWPHPVITGGRLYLREQNSLFCYDVTAGNGASTEAQLSEKK